MSHPNTIFVTSLFEMPHYVKTLRPARLISIIQPEFQPGRPTEIAEPDHLRVAVHDIVEAQYDEVLAEHAHIEALIEFVRDWDPSAGALMTHCFAGVSRSTAAALIAAYIKTDDPEFSARALRDAAPHAHPNRLIIELADDILQCDGELVAARDGMSPGTAVIEAPLTQMTLDLDR